MNAKVKSVLEAADDPCHCEYPPGFDWIKAVEQVRSLRPSLESIANCTLSLDDNVQDATYFASLSIVEPIDGKLNHCREVFALYFSCFGSLVGLWNEGRVSSASIARIKKVLQIHGFVVLDADQLEEMYSGSHIGFTGRRWLDRFFNYI